MPNRVKASKPALSFFTGNSGTVHPGIPARRSDFGFFLNLTGESGDRFDVDVIEAENCSCF